MEPAEEVVRFAETYLPRPPARVLDLGYGAGGHLLYMGRRGYDLYGTEISQRAARITEERLGGAGLRATLVESDMTVIPFPNAFFAAVICRRVISHNINQNIKACLSEIHRVLSPGGRVLCTFISTESSLFGKGREVEPNTFALDHEPEKGVPHHFVDEAQARALSHKFLIRELYQTMHDGIDDQGKPYVSADWVLVGEKIE